jgi:hypothetical protein
MQYQPHPQMTVRRKTILLKNVNFGPEYAVGAAYRTLSVWETGARPEIPRGEKLLSARIKAQQYNLFEDRTEISVEVTTGRWFR